MLASEPQKNTDLRTSIRDEVQARLKTFRDDATERLTYELSDLVKPIVVGIRDNILSEDSANPIERLRELGIYTADIEHNCAELKRQVRNNKYIDHLYATQLSDGSWVPIAEVLVERISENSAPPPFPLNRSATEKVLDGFAEALKDFVLRRLVGQYMFPRMDSLVGGNTSSGGTLLTVEVTSRQTAGARVEYSAIYYISFGVLAAPTSPVRGVIPPGRYIFRLTTAHRDLYDKGIFNVPHDFDIHLNV